MPQCFVLCLYIGKERVQLVQTVLPPMTLPQSLLPEDARFAGVGLYGENDAYLYAVRGRPAADAADADEQLIDHLLTLAKKDAPQDFVLAKENGAWQLAMKDLEQDVF